MTQTADLIHKMAEFFKSEEFFEKGEDARLKLSPDDVRCMNEIIKALPSVKPQESCDVPDTNVGDIISKQTVLDTISELNAISFYEAQEDSKECYYAIKQAIKDLSPVKQEPQTGHWIKTISENGITSAVRCSECGFEDNRYMLFRYCPNCGCRMVEPQERSE